VSRFLIVAQELSPTFAAPPPPPPAVLLLSTQCENCICISSPHSSEVRKNPPNEGSREKRWWWWWLYFSLSKLADPINLQPVFFFFFSPLSIFFFSSFSSVSLSHVSPPSSWTESEAQRTRSSDCFSAENYWNHKSALFHSSLSSNPVLSFPSSSSLVQPNHQIQHRPQSSSSSSSSWPLVLSSCARKP
jgi:hypothetical protein